MIVLDTTVLVYAVGDDHALREPARAIVEAVEDGSLQATTTVEAIQEFVHVRAQRRDRSTAMAAHAEALVSADRSFASVRGLRWVDLAGGELASMLGR